jgi:hypothetical protein
VDIIQARRLSEIDSFTHLADSFARLHSVPPGVFYAPRGLICSLRIRSAGATSFALPTSRWMTTTATPVGSIAGHHI